MFKETVYGFDLWKRKKTVSKRYELLLIFQKGQVRSCKLLNPYMSFFFQSSSPLKFLHQYESNSIRLVLIITLKIYRTIKNYNRALECTFSFVNEKKNEYSTLIALWLNILKLHHFEMYMIYDLHCKHRLLRII